MAYASLLAHMLAVNWPWALQASVDYLLCYPLVLGWKHRRVHGEGASFVFTSPTRQMQTLVCLPDLQLVLNLLCSKPRPFGHLPASLTDNGFGPPVRARCISLP